MPKLRQHSRMCRWCGQAYSLGRRREFLPYCGYHCYWFDMELIFDTHHDTTARLDATKKSHGSDVHTKIALLASLVTSRETPVCTRSTHLSW
jgi:endogenous inhibitor of DNA gyrase (YacG/DUF329 family)